MIELFDREKRDINRKSSKGNQLKCIKKMDLKKEEIRIL